MTTVAEHDGLIRDAIALARSAREKGDHPFGALLVVGGRVVLRAENSVVSDRDPTRHAELNLIQLAWSRLTDAEIGAGSLYCSTEPCPMCTGAIYYSKIPRVVYSVSQSALSTLTRGSFSVPSTDLFARGHHETEVVGPILPDVGLRVHEGYWPISP